jgi:hypothetical protein
MSLPSFVVPEDTIQLWSIKTHVRLRPYLVGEEKLLLIAQATKDPGEVTKAVKQIISRCTFETVDPNKLPSFDIEWLFLQLRARSVSNLIESTFICQNEVPTVPGTLTNVEGMMKKCENRVKISIDINDIKMTVPAGHSNRIQLDDKIGVTLKYPTADIPESQGFAETLMAHLATVFTANGEVTEVSEENPDEVKAWVDTLSLAHVAKIREFFLTMPRLTYEFEFKCDRCGYTEPVVLHGLMDFFD